MKLHGAPGHGHGYLNSRVDFQQEARGIFTAENPLLIAGYGRPIILLMGVRLVLLTSNILPCWGRGSDFRLGDWNPRNETPAEHLSRLFKFHESGKCTLHTLRDAASKTPQKTLHITPSVCVLSRVRLCKAMDCGLPSSSVRGFH